MNARIRTIACPFTGEELAAVPAIRPDVTIIHAQRADRAGNVAVEGILGVQKEAVFAARRAIVTVEEVVPVLRTHPNACVLPHWTIAAVSVAPRGACPSYAHGYYSRDNAFYQQWDRISRDAGDLRTVARHARDEPGGRVDDGIAARLFMMSGDYTATELMTIAASRLLRDTDVCFVGIGAAVRGLQPRAADACPQHHPDLRVGNHRGSSDLPSRCRLATASSARRR